MATREKNLKKINDKLEKLTDEQLDQVAGGHYWETAQDSQFLKKLGLCKEYTEGEIMFTRDTDMEQEIQAAWKAVGVNLIWHGNGKDNEYFFGPKSVSRHNAYQRALERVTGKKVQ